jgi:hypothetical protein
MQSELKIHWFIREQLTKGHFLHKARDLPRMIDGHQKKRAKKLLELQVIACNRSSSVQVLACMQDCRRFDLQEVQRRSGVAARHAGKDGIMTELVRWKEYRVRQEIYKERLKQSETSADRVESGEATAEELNRISVAFFEQIFGERRQPISLASNT